MVATCLGKTMGLFLITVAFAMCLVVSISAPVTSDLQFLDYQVNGTKALKIGMWGSCTYDISSSGDLSGKNCTQAKAGFLVDLTYLPGRTTPANPYVVGKLATPLVLYPISAGLAFLAMLTIPFSAKLGMLNCQGAAGLSGAAMIIELYLYQRTDEQVHEAFTTNLTGGLSNCIWLGLVAPITAGLATLACVLGSAKETRVHGSIVKEGQGQRHRRGEYETEEYA